MPSLCRTGQLNERVYEEYDLKGICIEGLLESIGYSMSSYWGSNRSAPVQDLAGHATSLTKFQHKACNTDAPCYEDKADNWRGNAGWIGKNAKKINSNVSSSIKLCHKYTSYSRLIPIAMWICHQLQQHNPQSFLPPWSAASIEDGPFCLFGLAKNNVTT